MPSGFAHVLALPVPYDRARGSLKLSRGPTSFGTSFLSVEKFDRVTSTGIENRARETAVGTGGTADKNAFLIEQCRPPWFLSHTGTGRNRAVSRGLLHEQFEWEDFFSGS